MLVLLMLSSASPMPVLLFLMRSVRRHVKIVNLG